eukprot:CAMPEP_0198568752 /NCGR_PEP_ID=MMETSP1462-20131121/106893_1 /TAXON_ID=1333877 /ORGANISM="Brandtodinium nutriculum, Strain RCC3387" /LENGTH=40 /DNA_ID= /DNA_START= /DNA_END= /DNA_ORIENTATION=
MTQDRQVTLRTRCGVGAEAVRITLESEQARKASYAHHTRE